MNMRTSRVVVQGGGIPENQFPDVQRSASSGCVACSVESHLLGAWRRRKLQGNVSDSQAELAYEGVNGGSDDADARCLHRRRSGEEGGEEGREVVKRDGDGARPAGGVTLTTEGMFESSWGSLISSPPACGAHARPYYESGTPRQSGPRGRAVGRKELGAPRLGRLHPSGRGWGFQGLGRVGDEEERETLDLHSAA